MCFEKKNWKNEVRETWRKFVQDSLIPLPNGKQFITVIFFLSEESEEKHTGHFITGLEL